MSIKICSKEDFVERDQTYHSTLSTSTLIILFVVDLCIPKDKDRLVDWIGSNVTKQKNWYGKNTLTPHLANIVIDPLTLNHHPPKTSDDDVMDSEHWVSRMRREPSMKNIHFDKTKFQICSPLFFHWIWLHQIRIRITRL
jgi:hypothetical protein